MWKSFIFQVRIVLYLHAFFLINIYFTLFNYLSQTIYDVCDINDYYYYQRESETASLIPIKNCLYSHYIKPEIVIFVELEIQYPQIILISLIIIC